MLACWIVAAAWVVLTVRSIRELPLLLSPRQVSDQPDRFAEAQLAYLTGNYALAEEALTAGLSIEPRDPPALLLLAAVLRHTGRLNAADALLTEIPKLEAAAAWNLEWESERARLERDLDSRGELQDAEEPDAEEPDAEKTDTDGPAQQAAPETESQPLTAPEMDAEESASLPASESDQPETTEPEADELANSETGPSTLPIDTALESFSAAELDDQAAAGEDDDDQRNAGFSEAA
jgi:hypothetical protein